MLQIALEGKAVSGVEQKLLAVNGEFQPSGQHHPCLFAIMIIAVIAGRCAGLVAGYTKRKLTVQIGRQQRVVQAEILGTAKLRIG